MTPAQARELIALYFGPMAAEQFDPLWPETMLGLSPSTTTRPAIEGALQQRLAVIRAHPTGQGPLARQLSAALQSVADQMIRLYTPEGAAAERAEAPAPPTDTPVRPPARPKPPSQRPVRNLTGLEHDASLLLAKHGRVDYELVAQLTAIARAKGLPETSVGAAIANLAAHSPIEVPQEEADEPGPTTAAPIHLESAVDPADAFIKRALIIGAVGAGVVVIVLLALLLSGRGGSAAPTPPPAPAPPQAAQPSAVPMTGDETKPEPPEPAAVAPGESAPTPLPVSLKRPPTPPPENAPDPTELLRDLRKAAETARDLPAEADMQFTGSIRAFKAWWPKYEPSYRQAMLDAVTEYLLRVADDPARMGSALAEVLPEAPMVDPSAVMKPLAAADVWPQIWSCGMLVRLSRERNLPTAAAQRVSESLEQTLGADRPGGTPTFNSGIVLGVRLTPARLLPALAGKAATDPDAAVRDPAIADITKAFERWEQAAAAAAAVALDPAAADRGAIELVLDGIELALRNAPDPLSNQASFQLITTAVGRQKFRPGEVSRVRLLAWLADSRIGAPALNVATAAIASRSMAEGVDLTMILPARATEAQRSQLRQRFAAAWAIVPTGPAGEHSDWMGKLREVVAEGKRPHSTVEDLAQAATLARLNLAARLKWEAKHDEAANVLTRTSTSSTLLFAMSSGASNVSVARAAEEQPRWALQLLATDRTVAAKLTRLKEIEASGGDSISQMDADVLMEIACTSGVNELRKAAQAAAVRFNTSPMMLYSLIKVLPRIPRNAGVGDFVEKLTGGMIGPMSREDWMITARRVAVDRLLELMAGASPSVAVDGLAAAMAETYGEISGEGLGTGGQSPPERLRWTAERVYRKLRSEAERYVPNDRAPLRLDAVDARREARRSLATGPVQAFAAEQLAAVEAMAYVVTGEKPATAVEVRTVLAELQARRRGSADILEQVRLTEEAMGRLWALRLGEGAL